MSFENVTNFMSRQIGALKDLENLIDHDTKTNGSHGINPEKMGVLKEYVETMKTACQTAQDLAKFYGGTPKSAAAKEVDPLKPKPDRKKSEVKKAAPEPVSPEDPDDIDSLLD